MSSFSDFVASGARPWVTGTTYPVGRIVLSPADNYQPYVRLIAGAGSTDPSADTTNWHLLEARTVKSIQRGSATFTGSVSYAAGLSVTVSAINTAKAMLRVLRPGTRASLDEDVFPEIASSTSIKFYRGVDSRAAGQTINWELVEYY